MEHSKKELFQIGIEREDGEKKKFEMKKRAKGPTVAIQTFCLQ